MLHSDKPSLYKCKICSKTFGENNLTHRERTFKCNDCDKLFKEKKKLERHMNTHPRQMLFPCEICSFEATQKWNLKVHMKNRHPNINQEQ